MELLLRIEICVFNQNASEMGGVGCDDHRNFVVEINDLFRVVIRFRDYSLSLSLHKK